MKIDKNLFMKKSLPASWWGFTLIELMVVISIIGILMGALLVAYQGTRVSARNGKRKADLEQIRSAIQMYHADQGTYPGSLIWGSSLTVGGITYMTEIPSDPLPNYRYRYNKQGDHAYTLCAYLESLTATEDHCSGTGNCGGDCDSGTGCNYLVCQP